MNSKFRAQKTVMRASAASALFGFAALLCALGAVMLAFNTGDLAVSRIWNIGFTSFAFVGGILLLWFAQTTASARVIRGKKVRLFRIISLFVSVIVVSALILTPVYASWVPMAVAALLLGVIAVMSIKWFK